MIVARSVLGRLGLAALTLLLLSMIVFVAGQVLPGSPSRAILGNFATAESIAQLDKELGLDAPLPLQYWDWLTGVLTGDLGESFQYRSPVVGFLLPALGQSLKLAALAFVLVVPLAILGGLVAALRRDRAADRIISGIGFTMATVPEFVTGVVLIALFAVELRVLPVSASAPEGAGWLTQLEHLLLPAIPLVLVLFGYLARITRASLIEALESDYVRTATLKGLTRRSVVVRHALRNALLPTVAVVATQMGYLIGGLVVIEVLFNYPGLGRLIYDAGNRKDFPMLQAGVLVVGAVYLVATLAADLLALFLNPRLREASGDA